MTSNLDYVPFSESSQNKESFDVGVIIALPEEFTFFLKYIISCSTECELFEEPKPTQFWEDDQAFWSFELRNDNQTIQVVAYLISEMGSEYTCLATKTLIEKWHVPFIINIGLTGSLDKDLKVGSILIPTQVTHYTANWKALENNPNKSFLMGTRAYATKRNIISQFSNFKVTGVFDKWQQLCLKNIDKEQSSKSLISGPNIELGHLASGNMVIDSQEFKQELKATDRKLMGCEMEAGGFMIAEHFLDASSRAMTQFIALRCISDMAEKKDHAEDGSSKVVLNQNGISLELQNREWAMRNATILFLFLLHKRVIDANISSQLEILTRIVNQLNRRKKETKHRTIHLDPNNWTKSIFSKALLIDQKQYLLNHGVSEKEIKSSSKRKNNNPTKIELLKLAQDKGLLNDDEENNIVSIKEEQAKCEEIEEDGENGEESENEIEDSDKNIESIEEPNYVNNDNTKVPHIKRQLEFDSLPSSSKKGKFEDLSDLIHTFTRLSSEQTLQRLSSEDCHSLHNHLQQAIFILKKYN